MTTPADREAMTHIIAQCVDHPSVYMGGPSRNSLRIGSAAADALIAEGWRRLPTDAQPETLIWKVVESDKPPTLRMGYSAIAVGPRPGTWMVRVVDDEADAGKGEAE